jgi:branched-chain amino acid transport system permease protein
MNDWRMKMSVRRALAIAGLAVMLAGVGGCERADLHQAEVCEAVASQVLGANPAASLSSLPDMSTAHGIITRYAVPGQAPREIRCRFESSDEKSADQLALVGVINDARADLDAKGLAAVKAGLERRGLSWKVSWIPTFGLPHGNLAPASAASALLYFLQLALNGITYGSLIGLVAMGFALIYGAIGVFNLAFGDVVMVAAFVATALALAFRAIGGDLLGLDAALALPATLLAAAVCSLVTDRLVFAPLRLSHPLMPLVASIGLSLVLQNYVFLSVGRANLWLSPSAMHGIVLAAADGFELYANRAQGALVLLAAFLVAACWLIMTKTQFGLSQRACAQDRAMAALLGIDINRVIAGTFGLAGCLAGAAGFMAATYYGGISVGMGVALGLKGFTAAIFGGVGNFKGAAIGGLVVGLLESCTAGYFYGGYKEVAVFALLVLLLIFRPQGILGDG